MADKSTPGVDLTFRLACRGDYDAVMRISEGIYGGTDYLPAYFHSYIDDADVTVFLALVGDQVVGLRASKIVKNGAVFISKAARVAPDWRGQGIDGKMAFYEEEWIRQNRSGVKYKRIVTDSSMKKKFPYVFSLPFLCYQCGPDLWWRQDPAQLAQLDTTGLPDVVPLQDADDDFCAAVQKCLPAEASRTYDSKPIILDATDWEPYNLSPTTLGLLQASRSLWTLKSEDETSLSILNTFPAPAGLQLCIAIYAKNVPTWKKHLLKHLYDASLRFKSDNICIKMFVGLFELEAPVHQFYRDMLEMESLIETSADVFECEL